MPGIIDILPGLEINLNESVKENHRAKDEKRPGAI
jgi:hypothetical protein